MNERGLSSDPLHRLVSSKSLEEDSSSERVSLRPQTLKEFIGQEKLKANLHVFIQAAKQRKESLDHVLLFGPPGLGKTTLAHIISREMGVGFRMTSGPILSKAGDLAAILTNLQPFDVLFIDEIHRLHPVIEEILYPAMEDGHLDLIIGEGPAARSIQIKLKPFTLVGATTRSGLVSQPLRERFGIPFSMQFYENEELQIILQNTAHKFNVTLTSDGALEIAKRCRGTPRVAGRLLRRVVDITLVAGLPVINSTAAQEALARLDVDEKGLDAMDRRYLYALAEKYGGGPTGIDTLAAFLCEQKDVVEEVIEPYLIQQGYIEKTSRGRMLTQSAYQYFKTI